jgi:hypothetical protein
MFGKCFIARRLSLLTAFLFIAALPPLFSRSAFLEKYDSQYLDRIFTMNIGIMEMKQVGNLSAISPIDSKNVSDTIKKVLDDVPAMKLTRKEASLKAVQELISQAGNDDKERLNFLEKRLFFSRENTSGRLVGELFKEMRKNTTIFPVSRTWFENMEQPLYMIKAGVPFARSPESYEDICKNTMIQLKPGDNDKLGPLHILVHGEIERIGNIYIISVFFYSDLLKKEIYQFSVAAESEMISDTVTKKLTSVIPLVFRIQYASLAVNAGDEEVRIYLDDNYIGREQVRIPFLVPGPYLLTLKKENHEDTLENINLSGNQQSEMELTIGNQKQLQVVNFAIEPLGTKIFINAVFQGRSPFTRALPEGEYVISAKNDEYEDYRYVMKINAVDKTKPLGVIFHLKSKDIKTRFRLKKILYYTSFWNFSFSLFSAIPMVVLAFHYWSLNGTYVTAVSPFRNTDKSTWTDEQRKIYNDYISNKRVADGLYAAAGVTIAYMTISLGWLAYALADYLLTLEKKDYIPIMEFYQDPEGVEGLTLGMQIKL